MKPNTKGLLLILIVAFVSMVEVANAFYDPGLQRWINRDPIQERGGINLQTFVGNNPINRIDSLGECPLILPIAYAIAESLAAAGAAAAPYVGATLLAGEITYGGILIGTSFPGTRTPHPITYVPNSTVNSVPNVTISATLEYDEDGEPIYVPSNRDKQVGNRPKKKGGPEDKPAPPDPSRRPETRREDQHKDKGGSGRGPADNIGGEGRPPAGVGPCQ